MLDPMAEIASAFVSLIPSAKGFGTKTSAELAPQLAAAGRTGGMGLAKGMKVGLVAGIGAVIAATKGLYEVGQRFEEMRKTIIVGTGASGEALEELEATARNVARQTPASFGDIGTAVAGLRTRLGLTGKPLEQLSLTMLRLTRLTGTDLKTNIADLTRLFGDWSIPTRKQGKALDEVLRTSQATGIGINKLAQQVVFFGAPLRQFGFSFEQSLALFGKWEKEGVNTTTVLAGLKQGLGRFSKAGKEPVAALAETVKAIKNAGTAGQANSLAIASFGQRAGPDMAAAIREGRLNLASLTKQIKGGRGAIQDAANDTRTFSGAWGIFKNNVLVDLEPLATKVFTGFTKVFLTVLPRMTKGVNDFADLLTGMFSGVQTGGALSSLGTTFSKIGQSVSTKLLPALRDFGQQVLPTVQRVAQQVVDALGPGFAKIGDAVTTKLVPAISTLLPILAPVAKFLLNVLGGAIVGVINGAVKVITGLIDVIAGVVNFVDDLIHGRWSQLWGDFKQILGGALTAIIGAIQVWWNIGILSIFKRGFVFLTKGIWQRGWTLLKGAAEGALKGVAGAVRGGVAAIGRVLLAGVKGYLGLWKTYLGFIRAVVVNGFKVLRSAFGGAMAAIRTVVGRVLAGVAGAFRSALGAARSAVSTGLSTVVKAFRQTPGKVLGALKGLGGSLRDVGKDIVRGLIKGIGSLAGDVTRALLNLIPGPLKKFAGKLGITSPSKVFRKFGEHIGQGLANGIDSTGRKVGDAVDRMADKVKKRMQKRIDRLKAQMETVGGTLADLQSKAEGIASSISDAFRPDLFSGSMGELMGGLAGGLSNIQTALAAFPALIAAGIKGDFLNQLLASGNATLIAALAGSPAQAQSLQAQFDQLQQLSGQLGQQAASQATSADIASVTKELQQIKRLLAKASKEAGKETAAALNHTAAASKRRKKKKAA